MSFLYVNGTMTESEDDMNSKIKIILWDIDGTILNFLEAEKAAIRTCFAKYGLGICTDDMLADYSGINRTYWERLERGEITKPQVLVGRFQEFFAKYGLDVSVAPAFNSEYQIRLGDTCVFYPHAWEMLNLCREKGYLQYAVTNGTRIAQERKLANSGVGEILDDVYISEVVGVEKPMIGFFDRVFADIFAKKGSFERDQILIVGDSLTSDMKGGCNAGIRTCWFNPYGKENGSGLKLDYEISDLGQLAEILGLA